MILAKLGNISFIYFSAATFTRLPASRRRRQTLLFLPPGRGGEAGAAGAAGAPCKRRELTCPRGCHLSALVSDRVAGMAAAQVRAGLLAAVSPSKSHQSTSPALSVPDDAPPASQPLAS